MYKKFHQLITSQRNITSNTRLVIGVSGGVDSMVLLDLLCQLPKQDRPIIHIAHINHQLRDESAEEQAFIEEYASERGLPVYVGVWSKGKTIKKNVEQEAREYRYLFFNKIMQETNSTMLLTAHHKDDNIETILMRFIQGSQLRTLEGIESERALNDNVVIRPLLSFSKKEIYLYARKKNIPYYEDSSNFSDNYLRNRIRHTIRPMLESENPNIGEGVLRLAQEINQQAIIINEFMSPLVDSVVSYENNTWQVDYLSLKKHNLAVQSEVIRCLLAKVQETNKLILGYEHLVQVQQVMASDKPNILLHLPNNWVVDKSYDTIKFYQISQNEKRIGSAKLDKNQGIFLSKKQWLGFFESGKEDIPKELESWGCKEVTYTHGKNHTIRVRKREDGDKFVYNRKGQTKKVSRYFIDEKIPMKLRELSWLVFDEKGYLLWLLPFRESYLSIQHETDKIQYKLVYLYQVDE
ncbi:tRNA lysidine(34) synthetase TilS [Vagococcus sp. JNUCC 83]